MEEPAWKTLHQRLPTHLQSRFTFQTGKAIARGMGTLSAEKQLQTLIDYLELMQGEI
jgi:transcription-repair coupling factor (superfamily II helicase)